MAGQFNPFLTREELPNGIVSQGVTLGQVRDRITALVAADVPLDAPMVGYYDPVYLREQYGFEKPEDLEPETTDVLLDRLCDPSTTPANRLLIRAEILRRLAL